MSWEDLVAAIRMSFWKMPKAKRIRTIRKLCKDSVVIQRWIRKTYPDLYKEAFPSKRKSVVVRK